jgi:cellulose synthase/poly-beta-1,6-N-acetylglucosamine synthase-like glycosyltransferase
MMNLSMREWGHKHVFDFEDLKMVGNLAGFPLVNRRALRRSTFPELRGLEDRDDSIVVEMEKGGEGNLGRLPLVSILIPAYGARYFERALKSALRQTWPRTEIVICNDHPGSDIGKIIRKFAGDRRIRYRQNRKNLGATANYEKCYSLARGSYIKFLNDDDILEPACVEKMVCGLEAFGDRVGLVTSSRVPIDSRGRILEDSLATQPMAGRDVVFRGRDLGNFLLRHIVNTIGEPTSPMFRKKDLRAGKKGLFSILGKRIPWNVDVVMWLKLLAKKDALYLSEPLSRIRVHPQQQQQQPEVIAACLDSWGDLVRQGVRLGFLENAGSRAQAVDTLHRNFDHFYTHPGLSPDDRRRILEIRKKLQTWCAKTGVARGRGRPYRTLSEEIGKIRDNPVWAPPVRSRALLVS